MDPTSAIIAPWAQYGIVGSVVVGLGFAYWRKSVAYDKAKDDHIADVKEHAKELQSVVARNTESNNNLANAIDRLGDRIKT